MAATTPSLRSATSALLEALGSGRLLDDDIGAGGKIEQAVADVRTALDGDPGPRTAQEQVDDLFLAENSDETSAQHYRLAALEALARGNTDGAQLLATLAVSAAGTDLAVLVRKTMLVEHPHFSALRVVGFAPGDLA
jgi:hypothetical protein